MNKLGFPKTLIVTYDDEPRTLICPQCKVCQDGESNYYIDDYVDCKCDEDKVYDAYWTGMIWCYEGCLGRFVLDPYIAPVKITKEEALDRYPQLKVECDDEDDDAFEYIEVTLAKVCQLVDSNMLEYKTKKKLSREEITELLDSNMDAEICKKYQLVKLDIYDDYTTEYAFNLSVPVDSFNAFNPKQPFPKKTNLCHAGCYIYLKCQSGTGELFNYLFWGD